MHWDKPSTGTVTFSSLLSRLYKGYVLMPGRPSTNHTHQPTATSSLSQWPACPSGRLTVLPTKYTPVFAQKKKIPCSTTTTTPTQKDSRHSTSTTYTFSVVRVSDDAVIRQRLSPLGSDGNQSLLTGHCSPISPPLSCCMHS